MQAVVNWPLKAAKKNARYSGTYGLESQGSKSAHCNRSVFATLERTEHFFLWPQKQVAKVSSVGSYELLANKTKGHLPGWPSVICRRLFLHNHTH